MPFIVKLQLHETIGVVKGGAGVFFFFFFNLYCFGWGEGERGRA